MQIVIDIPEETANKIKDNVMFEGNFASVIINDIPLPKGHGRLIDADFLIRQYKEYCKENCIYTENERKVMCRACGTGCAIEMLENAQTVLAATEGS